MAAEQDEVAKQAFAVWKASGDDGRGGDSRPLWALRALLHPALRPFLSDPTRTIHEQFPSLDGHAAALLETPEGRAAVRFLGSDDRAALSAAGLWAENAAAEAGPEISPGLPPAEVGAIWGSLYLPAMGRAAPCRVMAAWGSRGTAPAAAANPLAFWPDPQTLRPTQSDDLRNTGCVALAAALAVLRQEENTPPDLWPGLLVWDVCLPGLPDGLVENAQGQSLQFPLALAFLSLLLRAPLPTTHAATGALGPVAGEGGDTAAVGVRAVGFVAEKAQSLLFLGPNRVFWTPSPAEGADKKAGVSPVRLLSEAVARFAPPLTPPDDATASENAAAAGLKAVVCVYAEGGADFSLVRQTLARFSPVPTAASPDDENYSDEAAAYAAFADPENALRAALAVRHALCCFVSWPLPSQKEGRAEAVLPRIGVAFLPETFTHETGEGGDEQAFLIARAAYPGQILLHAAHAENRFSRPSSPFRFAPLGRFRLLQLAPPVLIHALHDAPPPGGGGNSVNAETAPESTLDGLPHNLPVETLPLLGRKKEMAQLTALLVGTSRACLVTLVGGEGMGKTRLAMEAAARAGAFFRGGIWFISIGHALDEDAVAAQVADLLSIHLPEASEAAAPQVARFLNETAAAPVCLILDTVGDQGFEAVALFMARITGGTMAGVSCVVTSPSPLHVPGEVVFPVGPLACPSVQAASATPEQERNAVEATPAGAFFLSRSVRPFQNEEWAGIGRLCRLLRGVPLALALVAAQTAFVPCGEIVHRLARFLPDNSNDLTQTVSLPVPLRLLAQTLRMVMEYLPTGEKTLLRRLSVLAQNDENVSGGETEGSHVAGWSREAAVAVSGMEADAARDALSGLEARALVMRRSYQGRVRYQCLLRAAEWAGDRLQQNSAEQSDARRAHATYFATMARTAARHGDTPDEAEAFDALYAERHQLIVAAAFLHAADPPALVLFIADLADFFYYRGITQGWQEWPRRAIRIIETKNGNWEGDDAAYLPLDDPLLQARLYRCCAIGSYQAGDREGAKLYVETGLAIARKANHRRDTADLLNWRGLVHQKQGRISEAETDWNEARALYAAVSNKRGIVTILNNIGRLRGSQSQWEAAQKYHEEAAQICRLTQDTRGLCYALGNLGCDAFYLKNGEAAQAYFGEQLKVARGLKDAHNIATALMNLGDVLDILWGDTVLAVLFLVVAEQIFAKLRHPMEHEAASYLARIAPQYGEAKIAVLRRDFSRRSLHDLTVYPLLPPRRLTLPTDENGETRFFSSG